MSNKYLSTSICIDFSLLSFHPKEKGHSPEMTESGCLTPEEWHVGIPGWSATEPRDRIAGLIQRRAVQERKEIPQSSPHDDYPKEQPLFRKSVIGRRKPKEKGHNAEMTEPGCLTPEEWHVGSPGWSATEPRDRIAGLIRRRAVQERKEISQSSPHDDYPKEEPLFRKSVISSAAKNLSILSHNIDYQ